MATFATIVKASADEVKETALIVIVTGAATVKVGAEELIELLLIGIVASPGWTVKVGAVDADDAALRAI